MLQGMSHIAVVLYRLSHQAGNRVAILGTLVKTLNHFVTGADIAWQARFGPGLRLLHPVGVVVAPAVVAGRNCTLHQGVTLGSKPSGSPTLGDDVNVAPGGRIIGPLTIGSRVQVGANAVVTHDFGDDLVLVGIPAKVLRPIQDSDIASRRELVA